MSNQEHPGFIVYVDEEMKTEKILKISEVPPDEHFISGVPVVKVVFIPMDGNRAKFCVGPGDRLLAAHSATLGD